jgi:hypothetical protein
MSTDNVEWYVARVKFLEIIKSNREGLFLATLPYKLGIVTAAASGIISIPLLFHLDTVLLFNEYFVTTGINSKFVCDGLFIWNTSTTSSNNSTTPQTSLMTKTLKHLSKLFHGPGIG